MDELARFVVSLNRSIEHREEKRKDYIHALTVLEALEKEKKTASQTSDTSSASKKGEEIESNKLLAESAKEMLDTTTKRLLGDFNKFRKEREAHLKIILTEFSKMNSEETLEFQKVWATYSEDIEEDLQSTDQEVTDSSKLAQLLSQSNNNNF
jgi:DNA-binding IscR family transcriptional regulator